MAELFAIFAARVIWRMETPSIPWRPIISSAVCMIAMLAADHVSVLSAGGAIDRLSVIMPPHIAFAMEAQSHAQGTSVIEIKKYVFTLSSRLRDEMRKAGMESLHGRRVFQHGRKAGSRSG
ncbi:hypothetical protein Q4610_07040 [Sphingobium sp. HBC34]|uniref:Uncharacterized protein n=1 Tax=Sphingobium cyanobacteriorum TaxID=3063954 RepID=A0ABT8ZJU1_9SPHN|nr:hypothetical protein [Sphingobium sp. HBC34]MDO7834799.1 hypothetical protein [Sphingobium sp. HBC34]